MLLKFKQITKRFANAQVNYRTRTISPIFSKKCLEYLAFVHQESSKMSSTVRFKHLIKDFVVTRLISVWTRSFLASSVVRRCRRDRGVREVIQCFKHTFLRPRRTLMLTVSAAYKVHDREKPGVKCDRNITDKELKALLSDMDLVEALTKATMYCKECSKRISFDKKKSGAHLCSCKQSEPLQDSYHGWSPYMEDDNVIIWRKEYKPGEGLYAYKVYGRYSDVKAEDFAAIQVDGAYRRVWDTAVAALAVVERGANGVLGQTVLHWEVEWPRLFANRDYVFIRRHRMFPVRTRCLPNKDGLFKVPPMDSEEVQQDERPNVHSKAKRKSIEMHKLERDSERVTDNKCYVIISRSCSHANAPITNGVVRVTAYWSHMVVCSLDGPDKPGMEYVLTYYDEPATGGLPTAVTSLATSRAAPAFLARMHRAAGDYEAWRNTHRNEEPDFIPFEVSTVTSSREVNSEEQIESLKSQPAAAVERRTDHAMYNEENVALSEPLIANTQADILEELERDTEVLKVAVASSGGKEADEEVAPDRHTYKRNETEEPQKRTDDCTSESGDNSNQREKETEDAPEGDCDSEEEAKTKWWKYLYPFYYFL